MTELFILRHVHFDIWIMDSMSGIVSMLFKIITLILLIMK